jgi:hypothetical protein
MLSALSLALDLYFAAMLGVSGLSKLANPLAFKVSLSRYRLFPSWLTNALSRSLPWIELTLALALPVGIAGGVIGALNAILFSSFLGIETLLVLSGRRAKCGCYGATLGRTVDGSTVVTSFLLAGLALLDFWRRQSGSVDQGPIRACLSLMLGAALCLIAYRITFHVRALSGIAPRPTSV